ncbi:erythromycin esterase family protein [Thalassobellus suaedae]|uniref:Erythromycin esterase family protein n=1 Tax=Thalassobellus suaedae TaxID=3074124 RepID=A0ABY9Y3A1_9FLAO|nr:erythromycin esterase family protein [Flavobacteriaceae bacterium HL-DH10]
MKTILLTVSISLWVTGFTIAQQNSAIINDKEVISWLKQNAVPIKTIESGNSFKDLKLLKKTLKDAKIVALGESTHGTSEFFKMKHRLIAFLVKEMGFTQFAMEAPIASSVPINEYILYGKGDLYSVVSGQKYDAWDMEEFADLIEWLKDYNSKVPDNKKVHFFGLSMGYNDIGRERTIAYLRKVAPEKIPTVVSLFQILAKEEEKVFIAQKESVMLPLLKPYQQFLSEFIAEKDKLIANTSITEWETIYQYLKVMEQSILQAIKSPQSSVTTIQSNRNTYMALNLLNKIEQETTDAKYIVWAHDYHIGVAGKNKMGYLLRENFGSQYYSMSFECYRGSFQAMVLNPDKSFGPLRAENISTEEKNIDWYFYRTGYDKLFVDLREAHKNMDMNTWMETPQKKVQGGWPYGGKGAIKVKVVLKDRYDGILFIEESTPTHPTKALKRRGTFDN